MKIIIQMNLDNADYEGRAGAERAAKQIRDLPIFYSILDRQRGLNRETVIVDSNGNTVGDLKVTD